MKVKGTKCGKFISEKRVFSTLSLLEGLSECVCSGSVSVMGEV